MEKENRIETCMYVLYNYREICKEFSKMERGSKNYESTKKFIDMVNLAINSLNNSRIVDSVSKPISKDFTGSTKMLYYDVLYLSFLIPEDFTSEEIIKKIEEKYNIKISVVKLSKLKRKAAIALSAFLSI